MKKIKSKRRRQGAKNSSQVTINSMSIEHTRKYNGETIKKTYHRGKKSKHVQTDDLAFSVSSTNPLTVIANHLMWLTDENLITIHYYSTDDYSWDSWPILFTYIDILIK